MNFKYTLALVVICFMVSCAPEVKETVESSEFIYGLEASEKRPYDPWVFRSVLDARPRMITLALSDQLYVAYSTQTCGMYKAWKGNVFFDGAVFNTAHGPQPFSIGDAYMVDSQETPWVISYNGEQVDAKIQYRGHRFIENERVELIYEITHDGNLFEITESPEFIDKKNNFTHFERKFQTKDVPQGYSIKLITHASGILRNEDLSCNAEVDISNQKSRKEADTNILDLDMGIHLNINKETILAYVLNRKGLIGNPNNNLLDAEDLADSPGKNLIGKNDCKSCHNTFVKTIGPSYVDIAKRYPTNDQSALYLVNKIIKGGQGVWGQVPMTAHPELPKEDARTIVDYILALDKEDEGSSQAVTKILKQDYLKAPEVNREQLLPGAIVKVYTFENDPPSSMPDFSKLEMTQAGVLANFDNLNGEKFKELANNFALTGEGYIEIFEEDEYTFRIWSDDGSILYLNGEKLVDNDGLHGTKYKEYTVGLTPGLYPFKLEFYQGAGGSFLSLNWKSSKQESFEVIPSLNLLHNSSNTKELSGYSLPMSIANQIAGDGQPVAGVHPSFTISQARPDKFLPKVGGLDVMADGRILLSTWDPSGAVYIVDPRGADDPSKMTVKKIAHGLAEPLGVKVVGNDFYVMQKQEITQLIDLNGDEIIDEYRTVTNDWTVSSNFHEFGFGLEEKDGFLYANLAIGIQPGGASANPQPKDRGKTMKVDRMTGEVEFIAHGLRTPNGIGIGYNDEIYVADNQGDWLPASKIVHITKDAFFNSRAVDFDGTKNLKVKQPLVWLPQDEIGNSPSTPSSLNVGPFKNQMIHGEVTHGGLKRVFVEEVNGAYQGALFRFSQGFEAGINRISWADEKTLYAGGIGNPGNWGQSGKLWYGLQKFAYNGEPSFEMLAVRAKTNGIEIEFTQALQVGLGWNPEDYHIEQYYYLPTINYGGPKMDLQELSVTSANVSENRKKVFLEIPGIKKEHVIYIRLAGEFISDEDLDLWSTECWYTMNNIPSNTLGEVKEAPIKTLDNTLSDYEKAAGWVLLFDGETTNGWRNYGKQTIGSSWKADQGMLFLNSTEKPEGGWQAKDGGDIITDKEYEDYELSLEWKISNCGNSGIIYHVSEDVEHYEYVWQTGPEMQILDNSCHPDSRQANHRAGALYDMLETKYVTVKPAGQWNKIRLISKNGLVQHWQNGYKVVEYRNDTNEWEEMIKNSKFAKMEGFGKSKKGHISLQDHGDRVYFKNIKIREL